MKYLIDLINFNPDYYDADSIIERNKKSLRKIADYLEFDDLGCSITLEQMRQLNGVDWCDLTEQDFKDDLSSEYEKLCELFETHKSDATRIRQNAGFVLHFRS